MDVSRLSQTRKYIASLRWVTSGKRQGKRGDQSTAGVHSSQPKWMGLADGFEQGPRRTVSKVSQNLQLFADHQIVFDACLPVTSHLQPRADTWHA